MEKWFAAPILPEDNDKLIALSKKWGVSEEAALEKVLCEYKHIGGTEFKKKFKREDDHCKYVVLTEKAAAMLKNWENFYNSQLAYETFHHILNTGGSD